MLKTNPEIDLIVEKASEFAATCGHSYVTVDHLTFALINYNNFKIMLTEYGADWEGFNNDLRKYLEAAEYFKQNPANKTEDKPTRTHALERVFNRAYTQVLFGGRAHIQTIDVFLALIICC